MSNLAQDADAIIEEEKLSDTNSAHEDSEVNKDDVKENNQEDPEKQEDKEVKSDKKEGQEKKEEEAKDDEEQDEEDEEFVPKVSDQVEKAKSFIEDLQKNGLEVQDKDGSYRKWEDVLPAGQYLLSQLTPVKVQDKNGKTHEFLLLSDVEKAFPDGFEAKNNIEQMKFERGISNNEKTFDDSVAAWNAAKESYEKEVASANETSSWQKNIADEYRAMAKEGLVPEVGDPSDPDFHKSDAVKTLDSILDWMNKSNEDRKKKGLGEITSLEVAKRLMDLENNDKKEENKDKEEKKKRIDEQRRQKATLSNAPEGGDKQEKKNTSKVVPMSVLAEQIIAEEGLK